MNRHAFHFLLLSATILFNFLSLARAEVSLDNKQGTVLEANAYSFQDETGKAVNLGQYFNQKKPIVLAFVYYRCPGACTMLLNGMIAAMSPHIYLPGRDFELVVVSIDPSDTPATAVLKREKFLQQYGRLDSAPGWHFLTTPTTATIAALTSALGFHYDYDVESGMYSHPSALFFFTQRGTLSTVLEGVNFKSADFRQGIIDSASGRLGTFVERLNSFCISFLPHRGWLDRPSHWGIFILGMLALLMFTITFVRVLISTRENSFTGQPQKRVATSQPHTL